MNQYKIVGIQLCPDNGIKHEKLMELISMVEGGEYEFVTFDADSAICFFLFSYQYYEDMDENTLERFKTRFREIANDVNLEFQNRLYNFNNELVYFGY